MGESSFWYRPTRVVPDQRPLNGRRKRSSFLALTVSNSSLFTPALRTHSFVFFAVHETRRIFLSALISKATRRISSFFLRVQLSQPYVATGHTSATVYRHIFNEEFNLGFYKQKKDQCVECTKFELMTDTEKEECRSEIEQHLARNKEAQAASSIFYVSAWKPYLKWQGAKIHKKCTSWITQIFLTAKCCVTGQ